MFDNIFLKSQKKLLNFKFKESFLNFKNLPKGDFGSSGIRTSYIPFLE